MNTLGKTFLLCLLLSAHNGWCQSVTNGDFNSGATGWGCAAETGNETVYGGSNGGNTIAEVDALASLCQTLSGFTPGNTYYIAFDASRRTGGCPSPAVTNVDVVVSGGVFSSTVTRTNTVFGFTTFGFLFTANNSVHGFTLSAGSGFGGSTCGMIIDNVVIAGSALPIELTGFSGEAKSTQVQLSWSTATEKNNNYFLLEKSENAINFTGIKQLTSKAKNGNSSSRLDYETTDPEPFNGTGYYRLTQVDYDGRSSLSPIIAVTYQKEQTQPFIYPNPGNGKFTVCLPGVKKNQDISISVYDLLGKLRYTSNLITTDETNAGSTAIEINPQSPLTSGCYNFCISISGKKTYKKVLVE